MLKKILFALLIFLSAQAHAQYTDLKEYGLNGRVKSVETMNYLGESRDYIAQTILYFNKQGNIDSIVKIQVFEKTKPQRTCTRYSFKDGLPVSGVMVNEKGGVEEKMTIVWITPHKYTVTSYDSLDNPVSIQNYWLAQNYADSFGVIKAFEKGEVTYYTEYTSSRDVSGRLISSQYHDYLMKEDYAINYGWLKFDKYKNPVEIQEIRSDKTYLNWYRTRKYTYY